MKVKSFTYVKDGGESSNRTIIVTKEPSNNLHGIDISNAPQEFVSKYSELRQKHSAEMTKLLAQYGAGWRQFKPDNIKDIT